MWGVRGPVEYTIGQKVYAVVFLKFAHDIPQLRVLSSIKQLTRLPSSFLFCDGGQENYTYIVYVHTYRYICVHISVE